MADKLTYSPSEAAEVLGISRPTLYRLLHQEGFPAFSVGGRRLISAEGLRAWVERQSSGEVSA